MTVALPREAATPRSSRQHVALIACVLLATLMVAFNQTILTTALPTMAGELDAASSLGWVMSAFTLTSTMSVPLYGSLSDVVGRRGLFLGAITTFTLASVAAALSTDLGTLVASRMVQGVGGGGLLVLSHAVLADAVPVRDRPRYAGVLGTVWAVACVAGPLLGAWFTSGPGWAWSFWVNVPLGLAALGLAVVAVPASRDAARATLDLAGITTLCLATGAVTLLVAWAGTRYPWWSVPTAALALTTVVAAALLVASERRARHPVLPPDVVGERNFVLATGAGLLVGGVAMFSVITYLPVYLQMVRGLGQLAAGLAVTPMIVAIIVVATLTGFRASRTGRYVAVTTSGCVLSALALGLLSTLDEDSSVVVICGYAGAFGVGLGMTTQLLLTVVQNSLPQAQVGAATAANTYFRQVGATVGIAGLGSLLTARVAERLAAGLPVDADRLTPARLQSLPEETRAAVVTAYADALPPLFGLLAVLALVSGVLLVFLRNVRLGDQPTLPDLATPRGLD
ncbi:MAG: MFS transporter [Nocardioidaceae bacterium]|nr:MFS transporter [Nocardioidaceae bacterium]